MCMDVDVDVDLYRYVNVYADLLHVYGNVYVRVYVYVHMSLTPEGLQTMVHG